MGLRFIFMLTRNDRTVTDALHQLQTALSLGVRNIGFKDIGLPLAQLKGLNAAIKAGGATSYLEVVSLDRESEVVSAKAAAQIGVDILLGGTRVDDVLPIIKDTGIQYFPFPGRITGHPSVLEGTIEEIVDSAKTIAAKDGVHGLDLLAYRSAENVPELMRAVCAAISKPVYIAGSIATPERIAIVQNSGAAGFTIGTAALDGKYPASGKDLSSQLTAIIRDVAARNNHLSSISKKKLSEVSGAKAEVQAHSLQFQITKFEGSALWTFRQHEDELFFVHSGRLVMRFRDREELIEPGEFIVVPHGVEHSAVAIDSAAPVVLTATMTSSN